MGMIFYRYMSWVWQVRQVATGWQVQQVPALCTIPVPMGTGYRCGGSSGLTQVGGFNGSLTHCNILHNSECNYLNPQHNSVLPDTSTFPSIGV